MLDQFRELRSRLTEEQTFHEHIKTWFPLAIVIGICVGIAMSLFFMFIVLISLGLSFVNPLIAMAIGGLVIYILVRIGFEDPDDNGITYVIKRKHQRETVPIEQTQEFLAAGVSIGSGLPVGREGPALIIGSAIASKLAEWRKIGKNHRHEAITIGSAAASAALFQAPFGAAVFATEVPYKEDSNEPMLMSSFLASVVAAVTLSSIISVVNDNLLQVQIDIFYIGEANLEITLLNTFLAFVIGILVGLLGRGMILFYYKYRYLLKTNLTQSQMILAGLGLSLVTIFVGVLFVDDLYIGRGISPFDAIQNIILSVQELPILVILIILLIQILATTFIIAAGFPGGIFSPSLAIGALCGIIFAMVLGITDVTTITAWTIIGMSAFHAASTKTPIASILLVLEITGLPNLIIPIILANLSSHLVSGHRSLYEGQMRSREAAMVKEISNYDQLEAFTIEDIMTPKERVMVATPQTTLSYLLDLSTSSGKHTFPVVEDDRVIGIISLNDINLGLSHNLELVSEIMTEEVVCLTKKMNGRQAIIMFLDSGVERMPVINDHGQLEGLCTINDLLRGQQKLVDRNRLLMSDS